MDSLYQKNYVFLKNCPLKEPRFELKELPAFEALPSLLSKTRSFFFKGKGWCVASENWQGEGRIGREKGELKESI
jgi:hypothetical protein